MMFRQRECRVKRSSYGGRGLETYKKKKTIAKINDTKSWFFEKVNKIDKLLARLIKKKRERTQINKIRSEKGEVTTDTTEIQRIIRGTTSNCMPIKWTTWKKWTNS